MLVIEDIAEGSGACPPGPPFRELPQTTINRSLIAVIPESSKSQEEIHSESQPKSSSDPNNSVKGLLLFDNQRKRSNLSIGRSVLKSLRDIDDSIKSSSSSGRRNGGSPADLFVRAVFNKQLLSSPIQMVDPVGATTDFRGNCLIHNNS